MSVLIYYQAFDFSDKLIAHGSIKMESYNETALNRHLLGKLGDRYSHFILTKPIEHLKVEPDNTVLNNLKNIFGFK